MADPYGAGAEAVRIGGDGGGGRMASLPATAGMAEAGGAGLATGAGAMAGAGTGGGIGGGGGATIGGGAAPVGAWIWPSGIWEIGPSAAMRGTMKARKVWWRIVNGL